MVLDCDIIPIGYPAGGHLKRQLKGFGAFKMYQLFGSSIIHKFVGQAETSPELTAIVHGDKRLSYGDLLSSAKTNALLLKNCKQIGSGPVAILGVRGVETPLAILSCLLANFPFVVIDKAYPQERILEILRISRATVCLYPTSLASVNDKQLREKNSAIAWLAIEESHFGHANNFELSSSLNEVAYLLFTSGSTGFPKGIRTGHAPLLHFVEWYENKFGPKRGSRFSMLSGLSHDPLLRDVFVPLSTGGELHIPNQEYLLAPDHLFNWMISSGVQYTHLTPQFIDLLSTRKSNERHLDELRYVFCGGDILRGATVQRVKEIAPKAQLINFYGTSETPQAMAYQAVDTDLSAPYPIGKPISDVTISILDEDLNPVEAGEQGEIAIETEYLSLGYIDHPDDRAENKTRNVFLQKSLDKDSRIRTYLTGDVGYMDEEGRVFFCGRMDDQVKIRGYRVDCMEIATSLERHGLTERAIVLPETNEPGDIILIGYVTGNDIEVRQALPEILPSYMIPALIISIKQVPLLPNGKVDRAALRQIGLQRMKAKGTGKSHTDNKFLTDVSDVWGAREFDASQSFVELGGDSLSYVRVSLLIEEYLGFLPTKWENITFEAISSMASPSQLVGRAVGPFSLMKIESTLLFRAVSITLVVLDHARIGLFFTATSTLFLISGMSFARFLLPGILNSGRLFSTLSFIAKFGVPAALWQLFRGEPGRHIWIPDIFLMGTLYANPAEGSLPFWFLDILAASLLIFAVSAKLCGALARVMNQTSKCILSNFMICMVIFLIGVFALFFQTQVNWWNGEINHTSVGPFRWFWLLPFGACIQLAESTSEKLLLTAIGGALAAIFYGDVFTTGSFEEPFSTFLFLSIAVLIWCSRVTLPRFLRGGVTLLAQHSLFIYMFSGWVSNKLMPKLGSIGVPDWELLRIFLAIVFGIAASIIWNEFIHKTFALFNFLKAALNRSSVKTALLTIARVWRRE